MKKTDSIIPEDLYAICRSQLLFSDYEMSRCFKIIKELFDVFKRAKKRFDRKETLRVSPTVSQFVQMSKDSEDYPYILNDFRFEGKRICICQYKKHYYVYCDIDDETLSYFRNYKNYSMPNFYGDFSTLCEAQSLFLSIVNRYTEIPF